MAAAGGHVRVLHWLFDNGCPRNVDLIAKAAACKSHVRVLDWLYQPSNDDVAAWGASALVAAAENGHQNVLQ